MYEISLQSCCPQISYYIIFTLVVSCMRSAFSPATHRSLTTQYLPWWVLCMRSAFSPAAQRSLTIQYLPWWCHVWDQPSVLLPTDLSGRGASPSSWLCDRENRLEHHTDCLSVIHPTKQPTQNPSLNTCYCGIMLRLNTATLGLGPMSSVVWKLWYYTWKGRWKGTRNNGLQSPFGTRRGSRRCLVYHENIKHSSPSLIPSTALWEYTIMAKHKAMDS